MKKISLIICGVFLWNMTIVAFSEDEQKSDKSMEEVIVDFLKLRNPFLPQLPKEEIIKTPVEQHTQTIDNSMDMNRVPIVQPKLKVEEAPVILPKLLLQGIIFGVKDPQVIIDEQSYGVGEHVMGTTIKSIGKNGVTLLFGGKEFHVDLEN